MMRRAKSNRTPPDAVGEQLTTYKATPATKPHLSNYTPFVPGPNPELEEFIRQHATPYDPENDDYDVPAFERDLVVDKAYPPKAIYDMHSYWSKKHWAAIRTYIRHYLPEQYYPKGTGLILDCFSCSGMTGVAAMMEGRPSVLIDASPAAAFISHCYTHPVDPEELKAAYEQMMTEPYPEDLRTKLRDITGKEIANLREELDWLYATKCDRCGGKATTEYVVYSERFQCPRCSEIVPLFDCPEVKVPYLIGSKSSQKTELKKRRVCPSCLAKNHNEPHRGFVISTRSKKFGSVPVMVSYRCLGGCKPARSERRHDEEHTTRKLKYFREMDIGKIEAIEAAQLPHWYPDRKMMDVEDDSKPWGVEWRPGRNFRTIAELYTKRNLWAMSAAMRAARSNHYPQPIQLAIIAMALGISRMNRYVPGHWSVQNRILAGTYYLPQLSTEVNIAPQIVNKLGVIKSAQESLRDLQASAAMVNNFDVNQVEIPPSSVDYIFTDPAYVDKVQYGELNFIWESWLGFNGKWLADEIIVNQFRGKGFDEWDLDLRRALSMCFRVLKPGRWISLCYHDTDPATWTRLQDMLLDTGFEIHAVTVLDPKQKSLNQLFAEKVVKSDLVINCHKPSNGDDPRKQVRHPDHRVSYRVREIVVQTLSTKGGQTRDRLWDVLLKRLLTRGQMAEHRFDDILSEVAFRSESGRWFLKEEFETLSGSDINNEEAAGDALVRFARLRSIGVPAKVAAHIALTVSHLASVDTDEKEIEIFIKNTISDPQVARKFKLGGRLKGVEFYDCLFFYLTQFLKGRPAGKVPRRNLAEFLEEYLVRFKDGDKWLYRVPDDTEAASLRIARQTGLGRRIRQFVSYLKGEGDFPVILILSFLFFCQDFPSCCGFN